MFNQYIATRSRTSRRGKDSPASAGAAKIPRVGVNKSDLEAQGELYGWTAHELTDTEVREMSSSELRWHEKFNASNLETALATPAKVKEGKDIDRQWAARKIWEDRASEAETQAAIAEVAKFTRAYPQFIGSRMENRNVLMGWLKERNMLVTFENLVQAFEANALEGRLYLNPSAIGAGSESEVTGTAHHNFHLLLQAQRRANPDDGLSADEFFNQHKEVLADHRVPPIIEARNAKAQNTAAYFQRAETSTAKSGSTSVTEYLQEQNGVPPSSEKYSFQRLINSLSAEDFARRVKDDPQFAAAINKLNNDK